MKTMHCRAVIITLLIIAGLVIFAVRETHHAYKASSEDRTPTIVWSFDTRDPVDPLVSDAPTTRVTVQIDGKPYDAGTYHGNCSEVDVEESDTTLLSSVRCWAAGGGDDVGVFRESGKTVIKHRILEEGNAEEGSSFTGEFEAIISL